MTIWTSLPPCGMWAFSLARTASCYPAFSLCFILTRALGLLNYLANLIENPLIVTTAPYFHNQTYRSYPWMEVSHSFKSIAGSRVVFCMKPDTHLIKVKQFTFLWQIEVTKSKYETHPAPAPQPPLVIFLADAVLTVLQTKLNCSKRSNVSNTVFILVSCPLNVK